MDPDTNGQAPTAQPDNNNNQNQSQSRPPRNNGGNGQAPREGGNRGGRGGRGRGGNGSGQGNKPPLSGSLSTSRGQAVRAQKRSQMDAQRISNKYQTAEAVKPQRANQIDDRPRLKIIGLGGMDGGGSKNMILVEYINDAVILDCGNDLGVDLPGINYGIVDTAYLDQIKHKLRAYIITHGHLDHIGGLPHIVPKFPAPIYGSNFTIGRVEEFLITSACRCQMVSNSKLS